MLFNCTSEQQAAPGNVDRTLRGKVSCSSVSVSVGIAGSSLSECDGACDGVNPVTHLQALPRSLLARQHFDGLFMLWLTSGTEGVPLLIMC